MTTATYDDLYIYITSPSPEPIKYIELAFNAPTDSFFSETINNKQFVDSLQKKYQNGVCYLIWTLNGSTSFNNTILASITNNTQWISTSSKTTVNIALINELGMIYKTALIYKPNIFSTLTINGQIMSCEINTSACSNNGSGCYCPTLNMQCTFTQ